MESQNKAEDFYPESFYHNDAEYRFVKELGRGAFGIVYLYQQTYNPQKKLAIKTDNVNARRTHGSMMTNESHYLRTLNDKGCSRVIGYYGDGYNKGTEYMILEYIDTTLEAYVKDPTITGKRPLTDLAC